MTLGERLRAWRDHEGLSQADAAALLGIAQPSWWAWENNETVPHIGHAVKLETMTAKAPRDLRITVEMVAGSKRKTGTEG